MNQAFYRNFPPLANMPVIAPVSEYSIGQSLMGWQGIVGVPHGLFLTQHISFPLKFNNRS